MFNKKQDLVLKITNLFLVIIIVISLGIGIGLYIYENDYSYFNCNTFKSDLLRAQSNDTVDYGELCKLENEEYQVRTRQWMYINFSIAFVGFIILVTINFIAFVTTKKE